MTMSEQFVTCPNCGKKIQLNEALTHELEEKYRVRLQEEVRKKDEETRKIVDDAKREAGEQLARDRARIEQEAREKAQGGVAVQLKDLEEANREKARRLEDAQRQELEFRKRQRELEEQNRSVRLEYERKLDEDRKTIREQEAVKSAEEHRLREADKEKLITDLRKQIGELQRKAELSSQQAQGEVQETELESLLRTTFRSDAIEPVAKGTRGADVLQIVKDERGNVCGKIIWEAKRTKSWSDAWIQKLKDDQRAAKAELAVLVTQTLPKEIARFGCLEGVWTTDFSSAVGLATALRVNLIDVYYARAAMAGMDDAKDRIFRYLSGPEFKQRVEGILEPFKSMKQDLDAERRAMEKIWAKREAQLNRVIHSTAGLHGDLQGIIGSSLPDVKILELPSDGLEEG